MITSFEVGAVFKIINEASPALRTILRQVRELRAEIDRVKANMAGLGKDLAPAGLSAAVAETQALAGAWREVAIQSNSARRALGSAATAARTAGGAGVPPVGVGRGGGRGRHQPGFMARVGGGAGAHVGGPSIAVPGGSHVNFRGGAAAAAGLLGYGAYEAAEMEDAVFQLIYHSGVQNTEGNRTKFRKILQDSMVESGYGLHDIAESAKQEIRMFQGTPGGGIDVLPEMLRAATIESRLKGERPEESMKALIGLAHMTKQYDPEAIKKLAPAFAFLSTANPSSLGSIEKAAGYAVPILQSSLDIDPMQSLLLGTALTRAGATSTKSGTWLREMAIRAMPGTAIFESEKKAERHDELLKRLGLLDDQDKPTWFSNGRPDIMKMLDIAGTNLEKIPLTERAGVERKLFGAQGSGGLALLSDKAVHDQIIALRKEMESDEFKNRYSSFQSRYNSEVTAQSARTALQEFNITMMDVGAHVLPSVNSALKDFKAALEAVRSVIPGAGGEGSMGKRALEGMAAGAAAGAVSGALGGPVGVLGGALAGGALGTAYGFMESLPKTKSDKDGDEFVKALKESAAQSATGELGYFAGRQSQKPINFSLNIDGKALARAVIESASAGSDFPTQAPAADGLGQFYGGDHNFPDK